MSDCARVFLSICLQPADSGDVPAIFGFAQYISTLALLVVVFNVSDFRYRYRLMLARWPVRRIAFVIGCTIGALILAIDVWFYNHWLIPAKLNSHNNLRAALAVIFLAMVFYLIWRAFISPPRFGRTNALQYFQAARDQIGRGNPEHLAVVADELGFSADNIIAQAARFEPRRASNQRKRPSYAESAHYMLLLLGDPRLCRVMVEKAPWTVARIFRCLGERGAHGLPLTQFARNIGSELVFNRTSALHHEESGYYSGFFGYTKPVSTAVYGNAALVEALATAGGSPLDLSLDLKRRMGSEEVEAYARAALIFCDNWFENHGYEQHSYAFTRMLREFQSAITDAYRVKGVERDFWKMDEYKKLKATVEFIRDLVELIDKHKVPHRDPLRPREQHFYSGVHEQVADLAFEVIFTASQVSEPDWTCWEVQHNTVWSNFFGHEKNRAWRIVRFRLRRMIYDEILRMNEFPNFKGARLLGISLNVLGFGQKRKPTHNADESILMICAATWTKRNYLRLVNDHPNVAKACLHGRVTFDEKDKRLVKTFFNELRKEPKRSHLDLDSSVAGSVQKAS